MAFPDQYFATFAEATGLACELSQLPNSLIDAVNVQIEPTYGRHGQTVNYTYATVNDSDTTDIGSGAISPTAATTNYGTVVLDTKFSKATPIPAFTQSRSYVEELATIHIAPAVESVYRKINKAIAALITPSNFNAYTSITGGADKFTRGNLAQGISRLQEAGVDVSNPNNLSLITHTTPYWNMVQDAEFSQASYVGDNASNDVNRSGKLPVFFGASLVGDPHMPQPTSGSVYAGLLLSRGAITVRTALQAPLNNTIEFVITKKNIPVKVQIWDDPKEQATMLHAFALVGMAVTRKDLGQYMVTT